MMFHGGGDDMFALFAEPFRNAAQNHVIGFRAAAGKNDFLFGIRRIQCAGNLFPCVRNCLVRFLPECVKAGGIAVNVRKIGHHGVKNFFVERGGCRIVHIYTSHLLS